jgi:hypothetical protein
VQIIFWTPHLVEYCSFYGFSSFAAAAATDQQITTICSREHIAFQVENCNNPEIIDNRNPWVVIACRSLPLGMKL